MKKKTNIKDKPTRITKDQLKQLINEVLNEIDYNRMKPLKGSVSSNLIDYDDYEPMDHNTEDKMDFAGQWWEDTNDTVDTLIAKVKATDNTDDEWEVAYDRLKKIYDRLNNVIHQARSDLEQKQLEKEYGELLNKIHAVIGNDGSGAPEKFYVSENKNSKINILIAQVKNKTGDHKAAYQKLVALYDKMKSKINNPKLSSVERQQLEDEYEGMLGNIHSAINGGGHGTERQHVAEADKTQFNPFKQGIIKSPDTADSNARAQAEFDKLNKQAGKINVSSNPNNDSYEINHEKRMRNLIIRRTLAEKELKNIDKELTKIGAQMVKLKNASEQKQIMISHIEPLMKKKEKTLSDLKEIYAMLQESWDILMKKHDAKMSAMKK